MLSANAKARHSHAVNGILTCAPRRTAIVCDRGAGVGCGMAAFDATGLSTDTSARESFRLTGRFDTSILAAAIQSAVCVQKTQAARGKSPIRTGAAAEGLLQCSVELGKEWFI